MGVLTIAKTEILRNRQDSSKKLKKYGALLIVLIALVAGIRGLYDVNRGEGIYSVETNIKAVEKSLNSSTALKSVEKNPDLVVSPGQVSGYGERGEASFYRLYRFLKHRNTEFYRNNSLLVELEKRSPGEKIHSALDSSNVSQERKTGLEGSRSGTPKRSISLDFDFQLMSKKTVYSQKVEPENLSSALPLRSVTLGMIVLTPLILLSSLYSNTFYQEKKDEKISLLSVAPVKNWKIITGKSLPYYGASVILSLSLVFVTGLNFSIYIIPSLVALSTVYFSVHFALAVAASDPSDLSTMKTFTGSTLVGMLIVPTFFIQTSDISFISPLTPVVSTAIATNTTPLNALISIVPSSSLALMIYWAFKPGFSDEALLQRKSSEPLVLDLLRSIFDRKSILLLSGLITVPMALFGQLGITGIAIFMGTIGAIILLVGGVFIEEILKGFMAVLEEEDTVLRGLIAGISFGAVERLLLLTVSGPLYLMETSTQMILVPVIIHGGLSALFGYKAKEKTSLRRRLIVGAIYTAPIHLIYNVAVVIFSV